MSTYSVATREVSRISSVPTSSVEVHLTKVRLMTDADVDNYIEAGHSEEPSAAPPTEPEHEMPFEDEFENDRTDKYVYLDRSFKINCKYNYKFKK